MKTLILTLSLLATFSASAANPHSGENISTIASKRAIKAQIIQSMEANIAWMSQTDVTVEQIHARHLANNQALIEQMEAWNQENPERALDVAAYAHVLDTSSGQLENYKSKTLIILKARQQLEKAKSLENYLFYFTRDLAYAVNLPYAGITEFDAIILMPFAFLFDCMLIGPELLLTIATGF